MYKSKRPNVMIFVSAMLIGSLALWLVRSQSTVADGAYMKAMIPHHSIAVMTSVRARIKDPEVRGLADGIIDAQLREIVEMDRAIARLEQNPPNSKSLLCRPIARSIAGRRRPKRTRAPGSTPCAYHAEGNGVRPGN